MNDNRERSSSQDFLKMITEFYMVFLINLAN